MSLLHRLRTAPANLVPGVVALGAVVAIGVAFAGYATGRLSTTGTFPGALAGLVALGALTRRFGIALPGNGFSSYVLGVTTFAILERGWEFATLVAPLLTVLGDLVLRRLPLRLAGSNAAHLTAGSALVGIIYERLGGATGTLALEADNVGPIAALLVLTMVIINGSFYLELALSRSIAWLDARLTARWESVVYSASAGLALGWFWLIHSHLPLAPWLLVGAGLVGATLIGLRDPTRGTRTSCCWCSAWLKRSPPTSTCPHFLPPSRRSRDVWYRGSTSGSRATIRSGAGWSWWPTPGCGTA
jgi:hypothetical protein